MRTSSRPDALPGGAPEDRGPRGPERALEAAVLVVAAAGVVFFGGVHLWFQAAWALGAMGALAACIAWRGWRGAVGWPRAPAAAAAVGWVAWGSIQARLGLSTAPELTREALLRYGGAACLLVATALVARTRGAVRRLALALALFAALESLYGIVEHYGGRRHILLWPKTYPHMLSGTYVNQSHFAGLLAILVPVALGRALVEPTGWIPTLPSWRTRVAVALDSSGFWRRLVLLLAAAIAALGVALAGSRGAVLGLLFGVACFVAMVARAGAGASGVGACGAGWRWRAAAWPASALALALLGLTAYGPAALVARFAALPRQLEPSGTSRLEIARGAVAMVAERPAAGHGLGTFAQGFRPHQGESVNTSYVNAAHNDLLQLAVEAGLPAALVVLALVAASLWVAAHRARGRPDAPLLLGLVAALVTAGAVALVDLHLQLAGTLGVVAVLGGLVVSPGAGGATVEPRGAAGRGLACAAVGALALLAAYPLEVARAERLARPTVRAADDTRSPAARRDALRQAHARRPRATRYLVELARLEPRIMEAEVDEATRASAARLADVLGVPATEQALAELRRVVEPAIRAERSASDAARIAALCAALRDACRAEPANPELLACLALLTADPEEARASAEAAVRALPLGAAILIDAAFGRLRFARGDERARAWLRRGLALDPGGVGAALENGQRAGCLRDVLAALPDDPRALREAASFALAASRYEVALAALDRLAVVDERASAGSRVRGERALWRGEGIALAESAEDAPRAERDPAGSGSPQRAASGPLWLDRAGPGGRPLTPPHEADTPLARGRSAFAEVGSPGTLPLEMCTAPGQPPSPLCVLQDGRHLGHALVAPQWLRFDLPIPRAGWVELRHAAAAHRLGAAGAPVALVRSTPYDRQYDRHPPRADLDEGRTD